MARVVYGSSSPPSAHATQWNVFSSDSDLPTPLALSPEPLRRGFRRPASQVDDEAEDDSEDSVEVASGPVLELGQYEDGELSPSFDASFASSMYVRCERRHGHI